MPADFDHVQLGVDLEAISASLRQRHERLKALGDELDSDLNECDELLIEVRALIERP
jgi:hypothetical protein